MGIEHWYLFLYLLRVQTIHEQSIACWLLQHEALMAFVESNIIKILHILLWYLKKDFFMPQLHLYVSNDLAQKIQQEAEAADMSVSGYLASLVKREVVADWPDRFFEEIVGG